MPLNLRPEELDRLGIRVEEDYKSAQISHSRRMERFARYYRKFRQLVDAPPAGDEDKSNFSVPLMQWEVLTKWATTLQSIFGDDAEIVGKPTAAVDQKIVHKIGRYMTWRVLDAMALVIPLAIFTFRAIIFGRSHAYRPYERKTYWTPDGEEIYYDGPGFKPLWPDELIVPAEDAQTIHDFSFVIHKERMTPQQLLDEERKKRYFAIKENFERILNFASQGGERDNAEGGDQVKQEKDEAEGVTYEGTFGAGNSLRCYHWYGRWRMPKSERDVATNDFKGRVLDETEIVVHYLPDLNLVIGVDDLMALYPKMWNRRPFCECALMREGSYWSPGFGEVLESIEDEATANHNQFTDAGELATGPLVIYKPGAGFDPDTFRYDARMAIASDDPSSVRVVTITPNLQYCIAKHELITGFSENLTGQSNQTRGRSIDRPNAPRTATGQIALIEQGNIRAFIDVLFFREDFKRMLLDFWMLDTQFAPESVFFRVTEEDAKGLFETGKGGANMTAEERGGRFDFDIKFATSVWDREARKERQIQLYSIDLQNPLVIQNPRALWLITNQTHRAMGDDRFSDIIPQPPDLDQPKAPREEWTLCLQGEDVEVNPMDNDDLHLVDHYRRIEETKTDPRRDEDAVNRMVSHIIQHQSQKRQKVMMQALTDSLVQQLAGNTRNPEGGGLNLRTAMPMPLQELQGLLGEITGQDGQPGQGAGQAGQGQGGQQPSFEGGMHP